MKRQETYKTKQKDKILALIKSSEKSLSPKEIYEHFDREIGLTTIYRFVEKLEEDGLVLKTTNGGTAEYKYLEPCETEDHFYLKCNGCGMFEHVDCKKIRGLTAHISKKHDFTPENTHIIINGYCKNCKGAL